MNREKLIMVTTLEAQCLQTKIDFILIRFRNSQKFQNGIIRLSSLRRIFWCAETHFLMKYFFRFDVSIFGSNLRS